MWIFGGGVESQRASIVDVDGREQATEWAAKFAVACRCAQEVREIIFDRLV